jgi:hypothetical protein
MEASFVGFDEFLFWLQVNCVDGNLVITRCPSGFIRSHRLDVFLNVRTIRYLEECGLRSTEINVVLTRYRPTKPATEISLSKARATKRLVKLSCRGFHGYELEYWFRAGSPTSP